VDAGQFHARRRQRRRSYQSTATVSSDRALFDALSEELTLAVIEFLQMQINAGVDAIQIFDSLGGVLPANDFDAASGQWMRTIVSALNGQVPVIVYSKGTRNWKS
jgi:uroporphyrinogen decarboxylase